MVTPALSPDDFTALMARLGPFAHRPRLAVGVSGGADSLALALLAGQWAAGLGGEAVAVTVDHRLRPQSAEEARRVGRWLAAAGMRHVILSWDGDKPQSDIQAAARAARHHLLGEFCRREGLLYLLLGHHREDQAETLLLRLGRGSGVDGLAAMALVRPTRWGLVLRPLLDVPKARLVATLTARGHDWIEDSSNTDSAYARVRLRRLRADLAAEGLGPERLAATAGRMARARAALDRAVAEAAVRFVVLHPAGFARCAPGAVAELSEEVALRLLARLLAVAGGGAYPPRLERLERLLADLAGGWDGTRTLAGCRVQARPDGVVFCREAARMAPDLALAPGETAVWDGRFAVRLAADAPAGLRVGALGAAGWREAMGRRPPMPPAAVRPTLPAIFDDEGVCEVPVLGYNRRGAAPAHASIWPAPTLALTNAGFYLVPN